MDLIKFAPLAFIERANRTSLEDLSKELSELEKSLGKIW